MKARLSSTVWILVLWISVALFGVLSIAYYAGSHSVAQAGTDSSTIPGGASGGLLGAVVLALIAAISIVFVLSKRVLKPVDELVKFSERLVAGDARARGAIKSGVGVELISEKFI